MALLQRCVLNLWFLWLGFWVQPSAEFSFGSLADRDGAAACEVPAAGNVNVAIEVGRQIELAIADDGNFVVAECAVKETELEEDIQIRDGVLVTANLSERLWRKDKNGAIYACSNAGEFRKKRSARNELIHHGKNVTSGVAQPLMKALAWDFAAVEEPTNIFIHRKRVATLTRVEGILSSISMSIEGSVS